MSIKRMDEIEDMIARGQMSAAQVFTQMKQLCQASCPEIPDSSEQQPAQGQDKCGEPVVDNQQGFWQTLNPFVDDYIDGYEFRGDWDYTPSEQERLLIADCVADLLDELCRHGYLNSRQPLESAAPDGRGELCQRCHRNYQIVYRVPNKVWVMIAPNKGALGDDPGCSGGLLCPECAAASARQKGINLYFEAEPGDWLSNKQLVDEPVAWLCVYPDGAAFGAVTGQRSVDVWMRRESEGRTVCPLHTHPTSVAVPEGATGMQEVANNVCQHLPEGYEIRLCMENGSGWVELWNPDGHGLPLPEYDDTDLAAQSERALSLAQDYAGREQEQES